MARETANQILRRQRNGGLYPNTIRYIGKIYAIGTGAAIVSTLIGSAFLYLLGVAPIVWICYLVVCAIAVGRCAWMVVWCFRAVRPEWPKDES